MFTRSFLSFFFKDTATTEIYTLSLHDALPISARPGRGARGGSRRGFPPRRAATRHPAPRPRSRERPRAARGARRSRSEEHTSELQSRQYLVCRLLLEKKKKHKRTVDETYKMST